MTPKPKSPFRWSSDTPCRAGYWWYLADDSSEETIVYIWHEAGEWSIQYRNLDDPTDDEEACVDFLVNYAKPEARWCYIPTPT